MKRLSLLAAFGLAALVTSPAAAQTTIDTGLPTALNPDGPLFGPPSLRGSEAYAGQTFTVPTIDYILATLGFTGTSANGNGNPTLWLYAWSGGLSGPLLYGGSTTFASSTGQNATIGFGSYDYLWNVGGLALTPGAEYVAFLGDAVLRDLLLDVQSNSYQGGTSVGVAVTALAGPPATGWTVRGTDVAFRATFTGPAVGVPEPSTYLLMLSGVLGLGFVAWRRKEDLAA